jgi:hypothetical protein
MPKFCSIFSQLLQLFPRLQFEQAVRDHKAEYQARGFTSWGPKAEVSIQEQAREPGFERHRPFLIRF